VRRSIRSIGGVLAGYIVFALSAVVLFRAAGRDPHAAQPLWFMALATGYGMCFAALGGALAVRLAGYRPQLHAVLVAGLIALGAAGSLITSPGDHARWSQLAALVCMAPCALIGMRFAKSAT
jgi:nitroreductase